MPIPFFLNERPRGDCERTAPLSFRKLASSTKMARLQASQYENLLIDVLSYLDCFLEFQKHQVPFFNIDFHTLTDRQIESIAEKSGGHGGLEMDLFPI
jgi:hypothetical protein